MSAPRCFGSRAISSIVAALVLKSRSYSSRLFWRTRAESDCGRVKTINARKVDKVRELLKSAQERQNRKTRTPRRLRIDTLRLGRRSRREFEIRDKRRKNGVSTRERT